MILELKSANPDCGNIGLGGFFFLPDFTSDPDSSEYRGVTILILINAGTKINLVRVLVLVVRQQSNRE